MLQPYCFWPAGLPLFFINWPGPEPHTRWPSISWCIYCIYSTILYIARARSLFASSNLKVASNLWPVGSRDLFAASPAARRQDPGGGESRHRINQNAIFDSTSLGHLPPPKQYIKLPLHCAHVTFYLDFCSKIAPRPAPPSPTLPCIV